MVYNTSRVEKPNVVWLRKMGSDIDRLLDDRGKHRIPYGNTAISPDGSKIVFERECKDRKFEESTGIPTCGFMVSASGGEPQQVCENCSARGFSSDGSVVLLQKYIPAGTQTRDKIVALDLATKTERDFLGLPDQDLYHAFFSWDDRWVVFKKDLVSGAQILIAPVRHGVPGKEAEWVPITDGLHGDDKPQFSPDGNTVYFTSTRDGYLCIWTQRLDPTTKHPVGAPVAFEHFHNSMGRDAAAYQILQHDSDLSVARDKVMINLPRINTDIRMVQVD